MAKKLQLRRGTTSQHSSFTGAVGEVTVDTDKDVLVVHDGSTAGGFPSVKSGSIATADLGADCVDGTKIADDSINSEHYVDGSIDTAHLSADCVDGTKIADDSINSEHYVDGSIDTAHLSADSIGANELKVTGNGSSGQYLGSDADGTFTWTSISSDPSMGGDLTGTASNAQLGADVVTSAELADNACNSEHYTDGSIDLIHLSADCVDGTKLADNACNSEHYTDASIDAVHLASGVALASGTKMVFYQASAPTGWTQDTTASLANRGLRIVVGSGGGTGGTHDLNSPPSLAHTHTGPSHTHTGPSHTHTGPSHTHTGAAHSHNHNLSAGAHTLTEAQLPAHGHFMNGTGASDYWGNQANNYNAPPGRRVNQGHVNTSNNLKTASTGSGSSHSHSLAGSVSSGGSGATGSGGTGATGSSGTAATGSSGTGATSSTTPTAFAPKYVDVIVASKD